MEWQTIDTAPREPRDEFREILLGGGDFKTKAVIGYGCMLLDEDGNEEWQFIWNEGRVYPTHWMPLPQPPKP